MLTPCSMYITMSFNNRKYQSRSDGEVVAEKNRIDILNRMLIEYEANERCITRTCYELNAVVYKPPNAQYYSIRSLHANEKTRLAGTRIIHGDIIGEVELVEEHGCCCCIS